VGINTSDSHRQMASTAHQSCALLAHTCSASGRFSASPSPPRVRGVIPSSSPPPPPCSSPSSERSRLASTAFCARRRAAPDGSSCTQHAFCYARGGGTSGRQQGRWRHQAWALGQARGQLGLSTHGPRMHYPPAATAWRHTLLGRRGYQHQRQSPADGEHGASIMCPVGSHLQPPERLVTAHLPHLP
jgi:hypothetical protein